VFRDTTVTTQEWAEGVVGEFDADGRVVGIEVLDVTKRSDGASRFQQVIIEGFGLAQPVAVE
jgi:hypothetical protein